MNDGETGIEGYGEPKYGPTWRLGPTGVTGAYVVRDAPQGREYVGVTGAVQTSFWMQDGDVYAFRLEGRDFFARARNDLTTGYLELTEVENPYTGEWSSGEFVALTDDEAAVMANTSVLEDLRRDLG